MAFIDKADYITRIRTHVLDAITEADDTRLDTIEGEAIALVKSYLSARNYDLDVVFAATGAGRDPLILKFTIDITIYLAHQALATPKMPERVELDYENALTWLEEVRKGNLNPVGLPELAEDESDEKDYIRYGSVTKRTNHI